MFNRKLVLAAACLGTLLFGIVFLSLGSVNNMLVERFALNDNGIGTLTALDSSVPLKNHEDNVAPVSTMAFITCVWLTVCTVAEILADRGVKLYITRSHNVPGDNDGQKRLEECLAEYKRPIAGV